MHRSTTNEEIKKFLEIYIQCIAIEFSIGHFPGGFDNFR